MTAKPGKAPLMRVIESREKDEAADFVMDMLDDADRGNAHHTPRSQIDDEKRQEVQFLAQFQVALNDQLIPAGIMVQGVQPDGEGHGYRVYARDRVGRPYEADLSFDDAAEQSARFDHDAGLGMIKLVTERLLEARAHYFSRMH